MNNAKTSSQDAGDDSGERIAKVMARAGLCSRREAETWITAGRVAVNGRVLETPAVTVTASDAITVDGEPLPGREATRLWLYHKPKGLVTTSRDPEGRPTVFERLPDGLPRVVSVGRLDINTEGLLLLTNDGGLARVLELPKTGWLRRYRVRCFGAVEESQLAALAHGVAIDGVLYGAVEASLDRKKGDNVWLTIGLREGKNREVKNILGHLGLEVNRLIRISFGPFQLNEIPVGSVEEVPRKVLRDQLGERLIEEAGADFSLPELPIKRRKPEEPVAKVGAKPMRAPNAKASAKRRAADLDHETERKPAPAGRRGTLSLKGGAAASGAKGQASAGRPAKTKAGGRAPKGEAIAVAPRRKPAPKGGRKGG
ncbi:Ribosomal large subunit pseudouridine synthase B [Hartmannibacter diazotrophicus]|uniref:Pseudouridine synthase n=1 Tax=Hartmannibacter diazotrophicus TaxID=1482074 RepID=A0A2C9D326_9HYPH|nr:pseudouridine synthase [Hartmannibacter diazotrophicus]SON54633.1 Ribosomal large subunit pseudouridine synthase B [Hartmannibacter diazotrophicus]